MVDIAKQVAYWREGAEEDLAAAYILLEKDRRRHGLFFAHLAVEKALKALVCRQIKATPPRTHNLLQLARLAQLSLTEEQGKVLGLMNEFCREGRYPDPEDVPPSAVASSRHLSHAKEMVEWLLRRL